MKVSEFINYFISILVLCSPFSALPALLGLTDDLSDEERKRTGIIAGLSVGIILVSMTWIGGPFLDLLGISLHAFQIAGGVVVFMLALSMLNAETSRMKQTTEDQKESRRKHSIAVVPLAIPLMAGPGAISAIIVAVNSNPGVMNQVYYSLGAILVALTLGILLYFATQVEKMLGKTGINVVNRVAGLILAAMAVQTLSKGLIGLFPFLSRF